ncbi:MAG: class IV adenylate cyclase [Candidatus Jordarchaeales archaeon]
MIEVEIKYRVPKDSVEQILSRVTSMGGVFVGEEIQEDIYFQHPSRNFALTDEALRVRRVGNKTEITYKGPRIDPKSKTREEVKVEVDNFSKTILLFEKLGFLRVAKIVKNRKTYALNEILLHLDDVDGIGFFVEIETIVESESEVETKRNELLLKAEKLGIPVEGFELRSYLEIALETLPKSDPHISQRFLPSKGKT